ncbi:putative nuclease HARBI1 isoform X2 [Periplaneta americana]
MSRIIRRVSTEIARHLRQFVKFPSTEEDYNVNRNMFHAIAQFPGISGVIDCTHIPIQSPGGQFAELYRNRKGWMSLNVQLICGPRMEILDIVSRWPGSTHDSRIFMNSAICQKFVNGIVRGILLGDNGYPQLPYLFTPVLEHHLRTPAERRYNRAHRTTRNIIERLNGIWKQRFPCLRRRLLTKPVTTQAVIVACAILHNIGILRQDIFENVEEVPLDIVPVANANAAQNPRGHIVRQQFIQRHFM